MAWFFYIKLSPQFLFSIIGIVLSHKYKKQTATKGITIDKNIG